MRQNNGMIVGIFSLVIAVIIVMGVMTPIVSDWTTGERIENEGAGWLRMSYTSSPSYQSIAADLSGEGVVIYNDHDGTPNGTETLSGTEDTIIYADDNLALWYENDTLFLLGQIDGEPVFVQRSDAISLIRESDGIRVSATDTPSITFPFPTYAYEPNSNGNYAFFTNGTPVKTESGRPNAIVGGGFAGVYAYNDIYRYNGLGLGMETEYDEDGKLVNVSWDKITEETNTETPEPLGAPYIRITHEDDIGDSVSSSESGGLKAVPTPDYTDGDWGYNVLSGKATIVSYSGSGGGVITIPSTVGGYPVTIIGKGGYDTTVFDPSITATGLVIPEGVTEIKQYAFNMCTNLTGTLVLPSTLVKIGSLSFRQTGLSNVSIPEGVTRIENQAFQNCASLTGTLVLPSTLTFLGNSAFKECIGLTGLKILSTGSLVIDPQAFVSCTGLSGTLILPSSITTFSANVFGGVMGLSNIIILTDAVPQGNTFSSSGWSPSVLDLSDTVDYSVNRYGLPSTATISDSIGDCFGYISFTEIGSDPKLTGPIATLLITVPLLMVVGLTIAAMTMMRWRVQ